MHMEENQLDSAPIGRERLGNAVTSFTGGVEPSSFAAAGDRTLVHLNSSFSSFSTVLGSPPDSQKKEAYSTKGLGQRD